MKIKKSIAFILICYLHVFAFGQAFTLHVKITDIRNNNGKIQLQIFKDTESFKDEKCWKNILITKSTKMKGNTLDYDITGIPSGTYGIAILDDENSNAKMDYSFMVPTEGFGFSNYYHTAWSKPKFDSFKFVVDGDMNITIKARYV